MAGGLFWLRMFEWRELPVAAGRVLPFALFVTEYGPLGPLAPLKSPGPPEAMGVWLVVGLVL